MHKKNIMNSTHTCICVNSIHTYKKYIFRAQNYVYLYFCLLGIVEKRVNAANENNTTSVFKSLNKRRSSTFRIAESVIGHIMSYNESAKEIEITPQPDYFERYFIPHDQSESSEWGPGRLGIF